MLLGRSSLAVRDAKIGFRERDFHKKKKTMNNLVLTRKRALKAKRLQKAQLATFKKGVFTTYKPSVFEKRKTKINEKIS